MAAAHRSADSRAQERRKIPAKQSLRRSRVVVSTGPRTIDLRELRSVQARRITGRTWPPLDYVIVRDSAGVRMAFCAPADLKLIRTALEESRRQPPPAVTPRVSRLAGAVLGISPLPRGMSALWGLGSGELPVAAMFAFIIPALALSPR